MFVCATFAAENNHIGFEGSWQMSDLPFKMEYNKRSGLWKISGVSSLSDFTFPSDERVIELWQEHLKAPADCFSGVVACNCKYLEINIPRSTPKERKDFLVALAAECRIDSEPLENFVRGRLDKFIFEMSVNSGENQNEVKKAILSLLS